jgi:uncharacterized protein (TIGR02246 family)
MKRLAIGFALLLCIFAGSALAQASPATDRPEDRAALQALLATGADALNTRKFDAISTHLAPNFHIITVDAGKHVGLDDFRKYFAALLEGPNATLRDFKAELATDEDTRFIDDNTAMSHGTSRETYTFRDGDVRSMQSRWSAVTHKDGTDWKLVNIQFTANVLDNPVIEGTKSFAQKLAIGVAAAGLVIGFLVARLLRRRA